ncbi:hypothetical protein E4U42_000919 [Claviceps africana]|uniref:AA1-like domain-containing protein n=1 Tax=Claviceps africana TaxID=83212 RepID=A0A8K0J070_9HYPO|nr:hypothetical protein E4U42_000919 [Claviceps africana]
MRVSASASALLLATVAVAAPAPPVDPTTNSCTRSSSQTKEWQVKDFDFHASYIFTTPAHQNSWGFVKFTLENPSRGFTSQCEGSSNQLYDFFYGNFAYNCTNPGPDSESTFAFSRPSGKLTINQSWTCVDEGSRFWAEGATNLTLSCEDKTWQNPDWKIGQVYSSRTVNCGHVDASVPITSMSAVA